MSITIAGTDFEHHHYDQRGDVLYLSLPPEQLAAEALAPVLVAA
jgi:hypothetical protein